MSHTPNTVTGQLGEAQAATFLKKQGYKIIENIGDQYSDLTGGYSAATYKLPNPFYYIP